MTTLKFPPNDEFMSFCRTEGFPNNYNDCLKATLQNDLGSSNPSIGDLMRAHFDRFQDDDYFSVANEAFRIIKSYGTDAHVYLPGIGVINGLTAGNYLDSAGTTLATVDNPVGLVLDGAGSVGAELVTTQDLTNVAWTSGGAFGNYAASSATADTITTTGTNNGSRSFRFAVTVGQSVLFTALATYISGTSAGLRMSFGTAGGVLIGSDIVGSAVTSGSGNVRVFGTAPATAAFCEISLTAFGVTGNQAKFTNISAKIYSGIHATQATTANKHILRRGAVNLLTYSEQFDNAAWSKTAVTISQNAINAPNGTLTADKLVETATTNLHYVQRTDFLTALIPSTSYTISVYAKAAERDIIFIGADNGAFCGAYFNLTTGQYIQSQNTISAYSITSVGDGWYKLTVTFLSSASGKGNAAFIPTTVVPYATYLGDVTKGIYLWGAQLQTGSVVTDYIPTTTAAASSATGNYSWQFDGTDYLSLGSVPFQSTDDFAIIVGASSAVNNVVADIFSQRDGASTNAIYPLIRFDGGGKVRALYRDNALGVELLEVASGYAANTAYVISTIKSGNLKRLRQNTVEAPTSNAASGATTLTTSTIGASNSTTVTSQLVGRVYPLIAIKGTVTDADLLILEKFVGALSGVTI